MNDEILERIGSEGGEYRLFGPPGCGKTTSTSKIISIAQKRYGSHSLLVTSFSKAAARELVSRHLPVDEESVGTLHHHCYYALGRPRIVEEIPELIEQWNREQPALPIQAKTRRRGGLGLDLDEEENPDFMVDDSGDREWFQLMNRMRGQLHPMWMQAQQEARKKWEEFKKHHGVLDYTDLIEHTWRDFKIAPRSPHALFADEAQDLNPMMLALIRQWGQNADYYVLAFDDDQAIYVFTGTDPSALLHPEIPESHVVILDESYRLPRAVHAYANRWVHQLSERQEKHYRPRDCEGSIEYLDSYNGEAGVLRVIRNELAGGRRVMLLATCAYMLRGAIARLRDEGIPFHNPYRLSQYSWNPLGLERPTGPAARVRALVGASSEQRHWKSYELALWVDPMQVRGNLQPRAKDRITHFHPEHEVTLMELDSIFTEESMETMLTAFEGGIEPLGMWWKKRLGAREQDRYTMPIRVATERGVEALAQPPKVIVGTIHSVKGGEADTVILLPDVSPSIEDPHDVINRRYPDDIIRTFYVGMTRAREKLYLASASSRLAVYWP